MKYLLLLFAAFCGLAWADGVPLFLSKPVPAAQGKVYTWKGPTKAPAEKRPVTMAVNMAAIDSPVITVTIEGKTYSFIGKKIPTSSPGTSWVGRAGGRYTMTLTRDGQAMVGEIWLGAHLYGLTNESGKSVLREILQLPRGDDTHHNMPSHPVIEDPPSVANQVRMRLRP